MTKDISRRKRRLTASAQTETVSEKLLVGGNEYTGEFFLYGDPPIAYLEPDEQPRATLFNDLKGVGIDSKRNTITPDGSASSVFIVTDRRLLLLVGQKDGDWHRAVSLESVTGGEYHTGLLKHRVVVYTTEETYHLWVDASYQERALDSTVTLLESAPTTEGPNVSNAEQTAVGDGAGPKPRIAAGAEPEESDDDSGTDASATAGASTDDNRDRTDDPLATLERLKELHDNDVLTDEEFKATKSDLLDQL